MTENQSTRLQNQKEERLLKLYESMNPQGQQHLIEFAQYMTSRPKYKKGIIPLPTGMGTEYGGQQGTSQLSSHSVHVHSITEVVSGK